MNYHNASGVLGLVLIGISVSIGIMMMKANSQADLTVDAVEMASDFISFDVPDTRILISLTGQGKMEIGSPPVAIVDLETGHVELLGDPSEAARIFWEAVEVMKP